MIAPSLLGSPGGGGGGGVGVGGTAGGCGSPFSLSGPGGATSGGQGSSSWAGAICKDTKATQIYTHQLPNAVPTMNGKLCPRPAASGSLISSLSGRPKIAVCPRRSQVVLNAPIRLWPVSGK